MPFLEPCSPRLQRTKVVIWLYDNIEMRIEGTIIVRIYLHLQTLRVEPQYERRQPLLHCTPILRAMSVYALLFLFLFETVSCVTNTDTLAQGFDEFMNVVMDDAAEVFVKDAQPRRELGTSCIYSQYLLYSRLDIKDAFC